jgi:hypothetical protein
VLDILSKNWMDIETFGFVLIIGAPNDFEVKEFWGMASDVLAVFFLSLRLRGTKLLFR